MLCTPTILNTGIDEFQPLKYILPPQLPATPLRRRYPRQPSRPAPARRCSLCTPPTPAPTHHPPPPPPRLTPDPPKTPPAARPHPPSPPAPQPNHPPPLLRTKKLTLWKALHRTYTPRTTCSRRYASNTPCQPPSVQAYWLISIKHPTQRRSSAHAQRQAQDCVLTARYPTAMERNSGATVIFPYTCEHA